MPVFLDEVRDDRDVRLLHVLWPLCVLLGVGAVALVPVVVTLDVGVWSRVFGVAVLLFLIVGLFGGARSILIGLRAGPRRVVIDEDGVRVGDRALPWSSIRLVSEEDHDDVSVWIRIVPRRGAGDPFMIPGRPFPYDDWCRLARALDDHLRAAGEETEVRWVIPTSGGDA